jgi:hypothetical protein
MKTHTPNLVRSRRKTEGRRAHADLLERMARLRVTRTQLADAMGMDRSNFGKILTGSLGTPVGFEVDAFHALNRIVTGRYQRARRDLEALLQSTRD